MRIFLVSKYFKMYFSNPDSKENIELVSMIVRYLKVIEKQDSNIMELIKHLEQYYIILW